MKNNIYIDTDVANLNISAKWYNICGFPGYQLGRDLYTNNIYIRSFKCGKKYIFGQLKSIDKNGYVELTDMNNFVRKVHIQQLETIIDTSAVYPTQLSYVSCRNIRSFIDQDKLDGIGTIVKKPKTITKNHEKVNVCKLNIPDIKLQV